MKSQKNRNLKIFLTVAVFFMVIVAVHAQVPIDDTPCDTCPPAAPIDGLIGLAMLAGAFFGGKKLRGNKMSGQFVPMEKAIWPAR